MSTRFRRQVPAAAGQHVAGGRLPGRGRVRPERQLLARRRLRVRHVRQDLPHRGRRRRLRRRLQNVILFFYGVSVCFVTFSLLYRKQKHILHAKSVCFTNRVSIATSLCPLFLPRLMATGWWVCRIRFLQTRLVRRATLGVVVKPVFCVACSLAWGQASQAGFSLLPIVSFCRRLPREKTRAQLRNILPVFSNEQGVPHCKALCAGIQRTIS